MLYPKVRLMSKEIGHGFHGRSAPLFTWKGESGIVNHLNPARQNVVFRISVELPTFFWLDAVKLQPSIRTKPASVIKST